ncbi:MAG: conjugal transfer protein TrbL [Erythrobacter sp.]|nr:conjugal transfer protein TrbL [Erythrobacter sp.]
MACPAILTGEEFLLRVLTHIDCQAQVIGSYGYQALGQPGSPAAMLMTSLLTLFVALIGLRLLFGPQPGARDLVYDVLKIGIVLTLAFSWPAFRTVIYDVTLKGPGEIAGAIGANGLNPAATGLAERLQAADNGMVRLTEIGTGRNTGQFLNDEGPGANFAGTALQDESSLGLARLSYLAGVIGSLALLRIAAALLLALTPLVAGLLLFSQSRGLAAGWIRGLVLTVAGSVGAALVLTVELSILEPWLADALRVRALGYATPSAPTELFAVTLAFALVQFAMIWLLARAAFYRGPPAPARTAAPGDARAAWPQGAIAAAPRLSLEPLRAERISNAIETTLRREERLAGSRFDRMLPASPGAARGEERAAFAADAPRLGSSYRRTGARHSRAAARRDSNK